MIPKITEIIRYGNAAFTQTSAASATVTCTTFDATGCEWVALLIKMGVTDVISTVQIKESTDGTTATANVAGTSSFTIAATGDSADYWVLIEARGRKRILGATIAQGAGTSAIFSATWFGLGSFSLAQATITPSLTISG